MEGGKSYPRKKKVNDALTWRPRKKGGLDISLKKRVEGFKQTGGGRKKIFEFMKGRLQREKNGTYGSGG